MQAGLAIEYHNVPISQMSLHYIPDIEFDLELVGARHHPFARLVYHEVRTPYLLPSFHALL